MHLQSPPDLSTVSRLARPFDLDDPLIANFREMRQPVVVADSGQPDCPVVFVNDAFLALTGYGREEIVGRNARFLQGPETDPATVRAMREAMAEGRGLRVEVLNYRKSGEPFWNDMFMSPVRNADGAVAYWFGSSQDVTGRRRGEAGGGPAIPGRSDQAALLLHEVEHRVKNNLQLISSLIQFQARRTEDPAVRDALREVLDRVGAVSTVHRRLFQTEDAGRFDIGRFLQDLVHDLLGRARREDLQTTFELEPVAAPAASAAPLALLVNEVLVHGLRTGFPQGRSGRLTVGLRALDGGCRIEIGNDGQASAETLRLSLIGRSGIAEILKRQLGAAIEWRDNHPGAAALITLPMERGA